MDRTVPQPIVITSDREADQPTEYTLTWEAPNDGGLSIHEYEIGIRRAVVDVNFTIWALLDPEYSFIRTNDPGNSLRSYKLEGTTPSKKKRSRSLCFVTI